MRRVAHPSGSLLRAVLAPGIMLALGLALLVPLPSAAANPEGSGGVILDGVLIPPERVWQEYAYQFNLKSAIHPVTGEGVQEEIFHRAVKTVIDGELLAREALRRGYAVSAEEAAALRQRAVENWKGEDNFRTMLKMLKVTEGFIFGKNERRLLLQKMTLAEGSGDEATEEELRDYYSSNLGRYLQEDLPPLRYLFYPRGEEEIRSVYREIALKAHALRKEGRRYDALIAEYSRHESADRGGIVPELSEGGEGMPLQSKMKVLEPCRFSNLLTDDRGLHMYLRDCVMPRPFEEVRDRVHRDLLGERWEVFSRDLLRDLQEASSVEYPPPADPPPGILSTGQGH